MLAAQKSDEKWWSVAFPSLIKNVGYSILVLCPPTHDETSTVVSQRAWCLYEVVVAYGLDVGIDIVNGPSTDASLEEQLRTNFAAFADAVMKVDSRAATTSVPEDVDNIHRIVASVPGDHATVDDIYKNLVKGWIVRVMRDLCDKQTDETEENANFVRFTDLFSVHFTFEMMAVTVLSTASPIPYSLLGDISGCGMLRTACDICSFVHFFVFFFVAYPYFLLFRLLPTTIIHCNLQV